MENANRCTVNQILDRYQSERVPKLAPRTQKDYHRHIRILRQHFGDRIAAELVPRDFAEFMNAPKGRIHRNRIIAVLSAAFTFAVRRLFWLERNVIRDVARHESKPCDRDVTDAEFESFRASIPERLRIAADLAETTGQRQGDLLSLKWEQIQPIGVVIQQSKTGKRLAIRKTPKLKRILGRAVMLGPRSEYVLCTEDGNRYTSEGFRSNWQRYMRAWVAKGNKRFRFHDLRARCATKCATVEEAYALLGHTSIAMTRRVYDRGIRQVSPPQ